MRWGLLVTVFEALGRDGQPKFNAHVIVVMPNADARDRLIESLHHSSVYGRYVDAKRIADWYRLTKYLCKEATPQAWFGAGMRFRRIKGSNPLGDLGGDRVVLSRDLKNALLATGRIARFQRTYAKRQPSPPPGAVSHRRTRSRTADRPPVEPTPTPATDAQMRAAANDDPKAFFDNAAECEPWARPLSIPTGLRRRRAPDQGREGLCGERGRKQRTIGRRERMSEDDCTDEVAKINRYWDSLGPERRAEIEAFREERRAEGARIDPEIAEVIFWYSDGVDPYLLWLPLEMALIGRTYAARNPGSDIWVVFGDLPGETRKKLEHRHMPAWTLDHDDFVPPF
jgi:hypothetical protein